ncbi:unnamed protein product [Mytilus coruscus]|uniref:Uncharacterized protein n=1 Tax=Mytilus coruscus TaxID=42192 RepID=A0A6J8D990_MYTCO|nr:unnamed protein product [Mytilus coruscus]
MAEHTEESLLLQDDSLPDKTSDGATRSSSDRDLHDTFSLFKLYMNGKMDNLESRLVREQDAMSKKIKEEVSIRFKYERNRIQFKFNEETLNELNKLYKLIPSTEAQSIRVVLDLLDKVKGLIRRFLKITARTLAQVVGRIISMAPVICNVARIMTKFCYMAIECRTEWDKWLLFPCPYKVLSELHFWLDNITSLNIKLLGHYSKSHVIYSEASGTGAVAYSVELDKKNFHETWDFSEAQESSPWRELKAIKLALLS